MSYLYLGYLSLAVVGTCVLQYMFGISFSPIQKKAIVSSLVLTAIVFTAWDALAVSQNHWEFGIQHTLNVFIGNQPVEEILFFLIIPFFGIMLWEIAGKLEKDRRKKK